MDAVAQINIQAAIGNLALFAFYKFVYRSFDHWWSLVFAVNFGALIPALDEC
ncbi:hypothetical protein ACJJIK_11160 [Microbulbifer sp. ZKSA006]|uniref:hypothetical protein n=1 Tax=Microbulbifer sp. ZKSA006 TaxID=3243390 RepID=UPI004039E68C